MAGFSFERRSSAAALVHKEEHGCIYSSESAAQLLAQADPCEVVTVPEGSKTHETAAIGEPGPSAMQTAPGAGLSEEVSLSPAISAAFACAVSLRAAESAFLAACESSVMLAEAVAILAAEDANQSAAKACVKVASLCTKIDADFRVAKALSVAACTVCISVATAAEEYAQKAAFMASSAANLASEKLASDNARKAVMSAYAVAAAASMAAVAAAAEAKAAATSSYRTRTKEETKAATISCILADAAAAGAMHSTVFASRRALEAAIHVARMHEEQSVKKHTGNNNPKKLHRKRKPAKHTTQPLSNQVGEGIKATSRAPLMNRDTNQWSDKAERNEKQGISITLINQKSIRREQKPAHSKLRPPVQRFANSPYVGQVRPRAKSCFDFPDC